MFNFNGICHVIANPTGHAPGYNFSLVGAIPTTLLAERQATPSDVMAGRATKRSDGTWVAYGSRQWESVEQVVEAASANGVKLCASPTCACRKLF